MKDPKEIKAQYPTLVIVKCAEDDRTLDAALVFIPAGGSIGDAVQVGARAGIPDAHAFAELRLPDDFVADDYGLYENFAYCG